MTDPPLTSPCNLCQPCATLLLLLMFFCLFVFLGLMMPVAVHLGPGDRWVVVVCSCGGREVCLLHNP